MCSSSPISQSTHRPLFVRAGETTARTYIHSDETARTETKNGRSKTREREKKTVMTPRRRRRRRTSRSFHHYSSPLPVERPCTAYTPMSSINERTPASVTSAASHSHHPHDWHREMKVRQTFSSSLLSLARAQPDEQKMCALLSRADRWTHSSLHFSRFQFLVCAVSLSLVICNAPRTLFSFAYLP